MSVGSLGEVSFPGLGPILISLWHRTFTLIIMPPSTRGGDLGGRPPPQKFEVGDGPCIGPPQIFREVVLSDVCEKMNRVKNCLIKEFFSEIVVFLCRKGRIGYLITVNKGKSEKPGR